MLISKLGLQIKRSLTLGASLWLALGASACGHSKLHDTFGKRATTMFQTQSNARSSRESHSLGAEVQGAVGKYYQKIQPDSNGSGAGSPSAGGGGSSIAGIRMPLTSN